MLKDSRLGHGVRLSEGLGKGLKMGIHIDTRGNTIGRRHWVVMRVIVRMIVRMRVKWQRVAMGWDGTLTLHRWCWKKSI